MIAEQRLINAETWQNIANLRQHIYKAFLEFSGFPCDLDERSVRTECAEGSSTETWRVFTVNGPSRAQYTYM